MKRILGLAVLALLACGPKDDAKAPDAVRVQVEKTAMTQTSAQQRYSASVEPNIRVRLAFNAGGYVTAIKSVRETDGDLRPVQAGDPVRRGETLVTLRQEDFQARTDAAASQVQKAQAGAADSTAQVREAEGALRQASAAVVEAEASAQQARGAVQELEAGKAQAEAAVREAEAGLLQARANYDRARALLESESMTRQDYDSARAQFDMARAKADQARDQVAGLSAKLVQARAQVSAAASRIEQARGQESAAAARVDRARAGVSAGLADLGGAQAQLRQTSIAQEDSVLRSPLTGVVLSRQVEVGSLVAPGAPGIEVADTRHVKVVFGVPDMAVARLRLGQKVMLGTESMPNRAFEGRVTSIGAEADPQSRLFKVEVTVENPKGDLRVGMVAALDLGEGGGAALLTVPVSAIQKETGTGAYVLFVLDGTKARRREVRLGEAVGNRVVVLEGLKDGDAVITSGANLLHDGDPVQVVE